MDLSRKVMAGLQSCWGPVLQRQVINIIAYGSGAMPQTHDNNEFNNNTLDLMIEVRNSSIFHQQLMSICPQDYAGAAYVFGDKYLKWTDQTIFPMHSNHINLKGKKIKYSIVSLSKLRLDLHQWNYISFAGRLHKPILPIMQLRDGLDADIVRNREAATAIVLLMYGKKAKTLSNLQLFSAICQLSYMGDIRFAVAVQNPNKVSNIVNHNYRLFQKDYLPILNKFSQKLPSSLHLQQNGLSFLYTPQSLVFLLSFIPRNIIDKLMEMYPGERSLADRILLSGGYQLSQDLKDIIRGINRRSSFWMAAQNLITGSPLNNIQYMLNKLNKKSK